MVLISLIALFADLMPLRDPLEINPDKNFLPVFSKDAWLGTDAIGRDLLSRAIHGARVSLQIAYTAPFISLVCGLALGLAAGYFRGRIESFVGIFVDSILAFPNIVAIMAILFFAGNTLLNIILVLGFFGIPGDARITRANAILFSEREFVLAARAQGASHLRIIIRELLPNVLIPVLSLVLFGMSIVIFIEGALAFLGIGIDPPTPTWGRMISEGFDEITVSPHVTFVPAVVMFLTILSFNLMGDRIRAMTDIRASAA